MCGEPESDRAVVVRVRVVIHAEHSGRRLAESDAVLARKLGTRRILTFDERHFRTVRPLQGGTFTVLPADG